MPLAVKICLLLGLLAGLMLPAAPAALADCPDVVVCRHYLDTDYLEVGRFSHPTCYKLFQGCRPWHCEGGGQPSRDIWTKKCNKRFPAKCGGQDCVAAFPGGLSE
jgi:hypothetical protein